MPTGIEVANALRSLAVKYDGYGEERVEQLRFYKYTTDKERFLQCVRLVPRPVRKEYSDHAVTVVHETPAILIQVEAPRYTVCTLVTPAQPAVYECEPFLRPEELVMDTENTPESEADNGE